MNTEPRPSMRYLALGIVLVVGLFIHSSWETHKVAAFMVAFLILNYIARDLWWVHRHPEAGRS